MAIKFNRDFLRRIIDEELTRWAAEQLSEAPKARKAIAGDDEEELPPDPGAAPEEPLPDAGPAPEADGEVPLPDESGADAEPPADELPTGNEPADDAMTDDDESHAEEGTVAADLEGKCIESVAIDEESKIMPGATEVVFTFREGADALRLLVSKSGRVKIFYKGLHNDFASPVEEIPGAEEEEPEDELGPEEDPGAEVDVSGAGPEAPEGEPDLPDDDDDEELELP